jgi:hypothetical protein
VGKALASPLDPAGLRAIAARESWDVRAGALVGLIRERLG